jgi:hypothetical protein
MPDPIFSIRVHHSGLYADGRPNTESILINDLDFGFEHQNRKVPVYVPAGRFIDIPLTSDSLFSVDQGTLGKFADAGLITIEVLGTGSGGAGTSGVTVVDGESTAPYENGSWSYPWKTLQRAINSLYGDADDPAPAPPTVAGEDRTILVAQGWYDEDVTFPAAGAINVLALGGVQIGSPTSLRTITRVVDPTLNVDTPLVPGLLFGAASVKAGGVGVFGTMTFSDVGAGQTQNFIWEGGSLFGTFDASGQTARFNLSIASTIFVSAVWTAPTGVGAIDQAKWFAGTPDFNYLSKITNSEFLAGFTVAADTLGLIILDSEIFGTLTAPSNLQVDYFTNGSMATNAVVLAGGMVATVPLGRVTSYP